MKAATATIAEAKIFWSPGPPRRRPSRVPSSIPASPPATNRPVNTSGSGRPAATVDATPEAPIRAMTSSEVATARWIPIPVTSTRAGTITNPPPTPNRPESTPAASPVDHQHGEAPGGERQPSRQGHGGKTARARRRGVVGHGTDRPSLLGLP